MGGIAKPWAYEFLANCVRAYEVRDAEYARQLRVSEWGASVMALERIGRYIRTGK